MAVEISIPTSLRSFTGGATAVRAYGDTLGELLDDLETRHAGLRAQVANPDGLLHRLVAVYINDRNARYLGGLAARVTRADRVTIRAALAGGAFGFAALAALASARTGPGRGVSSATASGPASRPVSGHESGATGDASWTPSSC
jgi:molybdopterin converting factor small subunit